MKKRFLTPVILLIVSLTGCDPATKNNSKMNSGTQSDDLLVLQKLNAQFIKNYIAQDATAHDKLIHPDFVCIENSGKIVGREEYLKNWANDYAASGVESFGYEDEHIRIFGNIALVRAKSVFTYRKEGTLHSGASVYTDTYLREDGVWRCVQAHMTPVR